MEIIKCGIIMPISAQADYTENHWLEVKKIIISSLNESENYSYSCELVSKSDSSHVIQGTIVKNIFDCDVVICDVSNKNPNVMFELGMRFAFDKPVVVIKDSETDYSFDISPVEYLGYPKDLNYPQIVLFKEKLLKCVEATYIESKTSKEGLYLKHFGGFRPANLKTKDIPAFDLIQKQLNEIRAIVSSKPIVIREIKAGQKWELRSELIADVRSIIIEFFENDIEKYESTILSGKYEDSLIDYILASPRGRQYFGFKRSDASMGVIQMVLSSLRNELIGENVVQTVTIAQDCEV